MQFLPIILSSVLSAVISVAVTLIVLKYTLKRNDIPPHLESKDDAQEEEAELITETVLKRHGDRYILADIPDISPELEQTSNTAQFAMHKVFGESLAQKKKSAFSLKLFIQYIQKLLHTVFYALSHISAICLNAVTTYIDFIYKIVSTPFVFVLAPIYVLIQKMNAIHIDLYVHKAFVRTISNIKKLFTRKAAPKKIQKTKLSPQKKQESKTASVRDIVVSAAVLFSEQKNIEQNHLHFYIEAFLSIFFVLATAAVFFSGVPNTLPNLFLLYMLALLIFGSYMLSVHRSPRIFWTIGVSAWTALAYWYFSAQNTELYIGSVVLFLCAFLSLYAISSFMWYGIQEEKYTILEQGLFVLHPFLYLSGIYLLLISDLKYLVVLLCTAVLSMYVYFAQTLKQKKGLHVFTTVCYFVSLIAGLSAISILFDGFYRICALVVLLSIYMYKREEKKLLCIIPTLIYICGYALFAPAPVTFFPLANERFASYVVGAVTFFVLWSSASKHTYTKAMSAWFENALFTGFILIAGTGVFIELRDIQKLTTMLPGRSGEIVLVSLLLLASIVLYFTGAQKRNKFISLVSIASALCAIFLTVTKLIN